MVTDGRVGVSAALSVLAGLLVLVCAVTPLLAPWMYDGLTEQLLAGTRGQDLMAVALVPVAGATRPGSTGSKASS